MLSRIYPQQPTMLSMYMYYMYMILLVIELGPHILQHVQRDQEYSYPTCMRFYMYVHCRLSSKNLQCHITSFYFQVFGRFNGQPTSNQKYSFGRAFAHRKGNLTYLFTLFIEHFRLTCISLVYIILKYFSVISYFQSVFVDCLIEQTHQDIQAKEGSDVS